MKQETVEKLTAPFPRQVIKKTPQKMDYIPVAEVLARMNAVIGVGKWRVEIIHVSPWGEVDTSQGECPAHIVARVRVHVYDDELDAWTWTDGMGGQDVGFYNSKKEKWFKDQKYNKGAKTPEPKWTMADERSPGPLNLGDSYKGAVSDATKKALQAMGVALELARDDEAIRYEQQQAQEVTVDLWPYLKAVEPDGSPKLNARERAAITEVWKADGYPFGPGAVPQSREQELKVLIDSYVGTIPEHEADALNQPPVNEDAVAAAEEATWD